MSAAAPTSPIDPSIVVAVVGAVALVIGTTITALVTRRTHRDTNLREDVRGLREQVEDLRGRLEAAERRERIRDDYEHQLRADLDAAGLPVRPWPDGLTT